MIQTVTNIYLAEDLKGESFARPLKVYHSFFAERIERSAGVQKMAWLVANVATGIFAYLVLGILAGIGMMIKWINVVGVIKHNETRKRVDVNHVYTGVKFAGGFGTFLDSHFDERGWDMYVVREFRVNKENLEDITPAIYREIDAFTRKFVKVYVRANGRIEGNLGEISVQLKIREHI